ncbi:hypothetical protein FRC02_007836 [Tulasnella sp. 418]|nr:hypothetical protein FRC02_007836 [Tulasnella sp. 418]
MESSSSLPPKVEVKSILVSSGASSPIYPKKKLMFHTPRHPRYDSAESSKYVYNYKRLAQPINALAPSNSDRTPFSTKLGVTIPEPILRSFQLAEPFLLPLLFPLGLVSAVFQSLPMALSIIPLSIVAGIAGVFIIPLMCLGGVGLSAWVLLRALAKLLRTQSQLVRSKSAKFSLLCTSLCISGLTNGASIGAKGVKELKRASQVLLMGFIGLGALATYDPEKRSSSPPPTEEDENASKPDVPKVTLVQPPVQPSQSTASRSPSPPSAKSGTAKAHDVFQSLLLAQGTPSTSLTATVNNESITATPEFSPLSRTNSTPGFPTSNVSTPSAFAFTPMTPMTPSTPHNVHSPVLPIVDTEFSSAAECRNVELRHPRSGKHVRIVDPEEARTENPEERDDVLLSLFRLCST